MNEPSLLPNSGAKSAQQVADLFRDYRPGSGAYDEAVNESGELRAAWKGLANELGRLTLPELSARMDQTQRQLDLDGVAFNPYDVSGDSRPWTLDPVPLTISAEEWAKVSRGLSQRAVLANLVLLDLLGPQTLIKEAVIPPDAVFAHPQYLPSCNGLVNRPDNHVHLYAADLARSTDGRWWVTADKTRRPFGLGYVLQNRLSASRMLPEAFTGCLTERLAAFFMQWRDLLASSAPNMSENPRVGIWTKGPGSRSYFEDSFLARYMGYTLVEGEDLAVRDGRVMLKTLGGLLPMEVLLRKVEDHETDPVELLGQHPCGVSGLLQVVRNGNVTISNSIGSSLGESPLLLAFLPAISKHFLGEDLILPSVATWWCAHKQARKYVLENLDNLIIRTAFRLESSPPITTGGMPKEQREKLIEDINTHPERYVGQEKVTRSTAPVLIEGRLEPWSLALRAFAVAQADGYQVLPGALARVSSDPDTLSYDMTSGEKSQDVWIVSDTPPKPISLLSKERGRMTLRRGGAELPSRVADNLFWLGRNLERIEQYARLIRLTLQELTGEESTSNDTAGLLKACLKLEQIAEPVGDSGEYALARQLTACAIDSDRPSSLANLVAHTHQNALKVRDRMALDSFRVITELRDSFTAGSRRPGLRPPVFVSTLDDLIGDLNAISGLTTESMTRTQAWRFLDLGRRIERGFQASQALQAILSCGAEGAGLLLNLENCLQLCDSLMTYRNRYLANIQIAPVLDLLIVDETNPRSILFQLDRICEHVDAFPREDSQAGLSAEQRIARSIHSSVQLADIEDLSSAAAGGDWTLVQKLLGRVVENLPRLSDTISSKFLIHAGLQRHYAYSQLGGRR